MSGHIEGREDDHIVEPLFSALRHHGGDAKSVEEHSSRRRGVLIPALAFIIVAGTVAFAVWF